MSGGKIILVLLILASGLNGYSQKTKAQLEREKQLNLKKLRETSKILEETKSKKKASVGQLNALKQQERLQKSLINNISSELELVEQDIDENQWLLEAMQNDLDTLKKDYANMIYQASKANNSYKKIMFLFTSEGFYDLVMRINYLNQYTEARKEQVQQIQEVARVLEDQKQTLENQKTDKQSILNKQVSEREKLIALEKEKEGVIQELSQEEKNLKKQLEKQKRQIAQLEKMIADIVKREMEKNKKNTSKLKLTPEAALLSKNFAENKGRLIWPVKYGFVYQKFGEQWHPTIKGVKIINIGIDIQTKKGAEVRAVFDGEVIAVASVPGMNKMVMIQHGEYFTVYTKITNVFVKSGDKVSRKEAIGMTVTNKDNVTLMQFQVWKNTDKLDPERWLIKQ